MRNWILGVAAVILILGGAFFVLNRAKPAAETASAAAATPAAPQPLVREIPSGWKEYRSARFGFSLLVPESLQVQEFDEGGGAGTITFQNVNDAQGLQLFVVPYTGTTISDAQFKRDEPSGIRKLPKDISIDAVKATSFYSVSATLGETAEIWFIHDGYLFEATTPKPLASWFSSIMETWKFL